MDYIISSLMWLLIIGGVIVWQVVKRNRNRSAAQSGEDKARVRQALAVQLDGMEDCSLAYAHWEEQESYGRTVRTTFYRYAVAFQSQTMWLFPLKIDKKTHQVQAGKATTLTSENLGKVTVTRKEKNGVLRRVDAWLGDKQGHTIIHFYVDAENLRNSRWYPLNIEQSEECRAFDRFITDLAGQVAGENPGIDAVIDAEAKEGLAMIGAALSGGGVLGGFCFPPLGVILCLIGLIMTILSRGKGSKSKICLIISIVCMVWIAVYCVIYIKYIFV